MQIYVVTAYRFGDREQHKRDIGVYDTEELALQEADKVQKEFRGGDYSCEIIRYSLDSTPRIIKPLTSFPQPAL